jgi:PAS domain S-box-containing protein
MPNSPSSPEHDSTDDSRYRLLVDSITDYAIYMLDIAGVVTSWNAGAQRFKGYSAAEIVGQHFSRFYTEEDRHAGKPAYALATAINNGRYETEAWRVRKDGTHFWAHVVIDPIRNSSGILIGFAKITRDLTERRCSEQALRASQEQFRLLVQGVTDYAIYMLEPQGHVTSWNEGAKRIKGYEASEIIGSHFSRFYTEEDRRAGMPDRSLRIAKELGRFEKEGWRVRKDGTQFVAHVIIDAIRSEDGQLLGFAKVTRDVTERKQAQATVEQAQRAMHQAQKLESLGHLTGGIAHDFNNLLMAIISSLETLRTRVRDDPRSLSLLENALSGAERGANLTQRMLTFVRRQELTITPVDTQKLIAGFLSLIGRSLGPSIQIDVRLPEFLPPVHTDAAQLESSLMNLAVNAKDAMPDGGVITISGRSELIGAESAIGLPLGRYVCLSVVDSGLGMDEATVLRATEPFFTTKGIGKGTGLGLAMVRALAEQSGGRLLISSRLGKGTTIEIWLPVALTSAAVPSLLFQQDLVASSPLRILVVDDDELVLKSTCAMLEDLGHEVIGASSGADALKIVTAGRALDLVMTDQAMPGMTGVELSLSILGQRPSLPIIVASGFAELPNGLPPTVRRLHKPYRRHELLAAIKDALD